MGISYKERWQEADRTVTRLSGDIERLETEVATLRQEIARLNTLLTADPEVRQAYALQQTLDVVDLAGIARHMRVERYTPQAWRQRGHLPPVDFPHIKEPLWFVSTIKDKFVVPTKRIWYDDDSPVEGLTPAA